MSRWHPFYVKIDQAAGDLLIARITAHLPAGWSLGDVSLVSKQHVLAGDALYGYDPGTDHAWRLAPVSADLAEYATWRHGQELSRGILRNGEDPAEP
jgi:hypothetical protein